ncbi:hypothetical protein Taro_050804 [Colocasia esculenta]|uniref:Uncharacterized protein n=1 Tax=Colocasia esculenta TaxID=4460 RepID=A0A843XF20_COLES|nr:hypothetical protein [Colocasia esculenta]
MDSFTSAFFPPAFSGSVTRLVTVLAVGLVGVRGSSSLEHYVRELLNSVLHVMELRMLRCHC